MFGSRKIVGAAIIPESAPSMAASPQPSASIQLDAHSEQAARLAVAGGGAHAEAGLREAEEQPRAARPRRT